MAASNCAAMKNGNGAPLTNEESELYDRQIRLWGMKSQEKIRRANVLIVGLKALGSEILKNVLLVGINSVTIMDPDVVKLEDRAWNFLLGYRANLGQPIVAELLVRAQRLNPLVEVRAVVARSNEKTREFYEKFDMIIATDITPDEAIALNEICIEVGTIKFIYADITGRFGYFISDFGRNHDFTEEVTKLLPVLKRSLNSDEPKKSATKETVTMNRTFNFAPIKYAISLPDIDGAVVKKRENNKVRHLYIYMLALCQFQRIFNRKPDPPDCIEFSNIVKDLLDIFEVSIDTDFTFYQTLVRPLPVVASIIGGIIGQEVVKAVSNREVPINNVFLFDPIRYLGCEMTMTPPTKL